MNSERQQAINYLRAPANGLWRWAEDGAVIVGSDGRTIAFREEIAQILQWLSSQGLPPFGAIVMLLAGCRGSYPFIPPLPSGTKPGAKILPATLQRAAQLHAAVEELRKLSKLPDEIKSGIKAKCVLAEAIFEANKVERFSEARQVLSGMLEPMSDADLNPSEDSAKDNVTQRHVFIVAEGLKPHTAESLALRIRTGLEALPEETDGHLPVAERARRLIENLSRDREYGSVARAARELMAAVRLPRRLAQREELAVGGISDITNRGPLDRLLLSELAHDDLTLAVRVALNEALYLRREPPMREPPGTLAVLLDSGIRLWGVPRVLASAVALALAACDKQHDKALFWRARGKEILPVELLTKKGLTEHLGSLEAAAHCGEAVVAFSAAAPAGEQNQSVLITHRDCLDDPEFRNALTMGQRTPDFVATVDRAGHFELHALPLAHRQPICESELDLAAVFAEKATGISLINPLLAAKLPAIFGVSPFPFLLPFSGRPEHWIKSHDGFTYSILNDRRLVRFRDYNSGGRVLASDLPPGKTVWMSRVEDMVHVVKASTTQRPSWLLSIPVTGGAPRAFELEAGSELLAIHRCGEVILAIRRHDVRAYSLADGKLLGRVLNSYHWVHGRFLRVKDRYWFPVWDGQQVKFEPVTFPKDIAPNAASAIVLFDREGVDGPWLADVSGTITSTATGESVRLPLPPGIRNGPDTIRVSVDGHRVFAATLMPKWACVLDLQTGQIQNRPVRQQHWVPDMLDPPPTLPNWNLYRVIDLLGQYGDFLAFCGRKGRWRWITFASERIIIRDADSHGVNVTWPGSAPLSFAYSPVPASLGCTLQVAEWPNGSKAFLDSRGLLHLKSHDPSLADVSLVLADGEVAGWTSDGHVCGPAFFFEDQRPSSPQKVFHRIEQFLSRAATPLSTR
jgi:MoxR-vWA-beta-propeller ternary system domain bpX0/MoxR-vWA-beta-propeller ternary system domain bpX1